MKDESINDVKEILREGFAKLMAEHSPTRIDVARLYDAEEAAVLLRLDRHRTLYEIAESELPRRRVGPKGGAVRFLGHDLLRYILGMKPADPDEVFRALGVTPVERAPERTPRVPPALPSRPTTAPPPATKRRVI